MNDYEKFIHKYYTPLFFQRTIDMYFLDQNMSQRNEDYVVIEILFWVYY